MIDDATLDAREAQEIPTNTSWQDAPPLCISTSAQNYSPRLRTVGLTRIIDRSAEKEKLAAFSHHEAHRLLNARRRFGTSNRIRLSELQHLESGEFEMFLDLLGDVVSEGQLAPTGDCEASILTTEGVLSGPDHWISIEPEVLQ